MSEKMRRVLKTFLLASLGLSFYANAGFALKSNTDRLYEDYRACVKESKKPEICIEEQSRYIKESIRLIKKNSAYSLDEKARLIKTLDLTEKFAEKYSQSAKEKGDHKLASRAIALYSFLSKTRKKKSASYSDSINSLIAISNNRDISLSLSKAIDVVEKKLNKEYFPNNAYIRFKSISSKISFINLSKTTRENMRQLKHKMENWASEHQALTTNNVEQFDPENYSQFIDALLFVTSYIEGEPINEHNSINEFMYSYGKSISDTIIEIDAYHNKKNDEFFTMISSDQLAGRDHKKIHDELIRNKETLKFINEIIEASHQDANLKDLDDSITVNVSSVIDSIDDHLASSYLLLYHLKSGDIASAINLYNESPFNGDGSILDKHIISRHKKDISLFLDNGLPQTIYNDVALYTTKTLDQITNKKLKDRIIDSTLALLEKRTISLADKSHADPAVFADMLNIYSVLLTYDQKTTLASIDSVKDQLKSVHNSTLINLVNRNQPFMDLELVNNYLFRVFNPALPDYLRKAIVEGAELILINKANEMLEIARLNHNNFIDLIAYDFSIDSKELSAVYDVMDDGMLSLIKFYLSKEGQMVVYIDKNSDQHFNFVENLISLRDKSILNKDQHKWSNHLSKMSYNEIYSSYFHIKTPESNQVELIYEKVIKKITKKDYQKIVETGYKRIDLLRKMAENNPDPQSRLRALQGVNFSTNIQNAEFNRLKKILPLDSEKLQNIFVEYEFKYCTVKYIRNKDLTVSDLKKINAGIEKYKVPAIISYVNNDPLLETAVIMSGMDVSEIPDQIISDQDYDDYKVEHTQKIINSCGKEALPVF